MLVDLLEMRVHLAYVLEAPLLLLGYKLSGTKTVLLRYRVVACEAISPFDTGPQSSAGAYLLIILHEP